MKRILLIAAGLLLLLVCGEPDDLKQLPHVTPDGTRRWELEVPSPTDSLQKLRHADGIRDATLFGQMIHVLADESVTPAVLASAARVALDESTARPIAPSLEDVFVSLSGEYAAAAEVMKPPDDPQDRTLTSPATSVESETPDAAAAPVSTVAVADGGTMPERRKILNRPTLWPACCGSWFDFLDFGLAGLGVGNVQMYISLVEDGSGARGV